MLDISDYLPINTIVGCKFVKIISKYLSTISRRPIYTEMKSTHSLTQAKEIISFNETWKFGSTRNFRASIMADRSKALLTAFSLMICCHTAIWSLSLPLHRIEFFFHFNPSSHSSLRSSSCVKTISDLHVKCRETFSHTFTKSMGSLPFIIFEYNEWYMLTLVLVTTCNG